MLKRTKALKAEQKQSRATLTEQRKADKKAAAQFKKAQKEAQRADKESLYVMRKNTALMAGRFFIWLFLSFIFLKGVIVSVRPDPTAEVNKTIQVFKSDLSQLQGVDSEVLAFAQNFAVQYFTYDAGQESMYTENLKAFASKAVTGAGFKFPYGSSCRVLYASAYKKDQISSNQYDVWVSLTLEYTNTQSTDAGGYMTSSSQAQTIIKVPVMSANGRYIVEDLPVFANDSLILDGYAAQPYSGSECDSVTRDAIRQSLSNFFTAYYHDKQSVINYFLTPAADPNEFIGLNGRVSFERINSINAYYKSETDTNRFIVLVNISVRDKNGLILPQSYNLEMLFKDKQYYVEKMHTKSTNIGLN